jgi:hypothetical protein
MDKLIVRISPGMGGLTVTTLDVAVVKDGRHRIIYGGHFQYLEPNRVIEIIQNIRKQTGIKTTIVYIENMGTRSSRELYMFFLGLYDRDLHISEYRILPDFNISSL